MLVRAIAATFALCLLASVFLIVFGEQILKTWVGPEVAFSRVLMIGLGVWTTLSSVITAIAVYLNAANKILFQAVFALLTAIPATAAKFVLAGRVGVVGVVWSNVAFCASLMLLPYTVYLTKSFAKQKSLDQA